MRQIKPVNVIIETRNSYSGAQECLDGYLESSDKPAVQFRIEAVINGITLDPETSPEWYVTD